MKLVPQGLGMTVARKVLTVKKNSPHIFFAGVLQASSVAHFLLAEQR